MPAWRSEPRVIRCSCRARPERAALTLVVRGNRVEFVDGAAPDGIPTDSGSLAALEALLARYRAPVIAELPPFHGGIVGWLGYDTVREITSRMTS